MSLKTAEQYLKSLEEMNPTAYILGERIDTPAKHPFIHSHSRAVSQTYALAQEEDYSHLLLTVNREGKKINRFAQLFTDPQDLVAKIRMNRVLGQKTGTCFLRCGGLDCLNALHAISYQIDLQRGTVYHEKLLRYLKYIQENDLVCLAGVTDLKGDRSLIPSQQEDPDMYLRVIKKNSEGVVVRGAKAHQTGSLSTHEVIVLPSRELKKEDADYAISFALPTDTDGLIHIYGRGTFEDRHLDGGTDLGNRRYGKYCTVVVFDDVFVPWERVFMCGEYEFAGPLVRFFSNLHRHSHGGCKSGVTDIITGAAALIAEYNGVPTAVHIVEELVNMIHKAETLYGCCLAASVEAEKSPSGVYIPDSVLANVSKLYEGRDLHEMIRQLIDVAGGMVGTMPSEKDLNNPEIGHFVQKCLKGAKETPPLDRMKLFRLIERLAFESRDIVSNIHGGGSAAAHRMALLRDTNLDKLKELAQNLACIDNHRN